MQIELRPHQELAISKLSSGKVLWGGVGTGKSITALAYYLKDYADLKLLVITTAKKRDSGDWEAEAKAMGIHEIIVDSWQNIARYSEAKHVFLVADEQRVVGSGSWAKAFVKIAQNNPWIMLSATPGDTWMDYVPVFLANGFYKNRTDFKRQHVVYNTFSKFPKVDRYIGVGRLVRLRNQILVEMPYARHTTRHDEFITVDYDENLFEKVVKKRWHVYEESPLRVVAELFFVFRKVVYSDPSRIQIVKELLDKHPRVIVFYNFDYELEMLRSLADTTLRGESGTESSTKRSSSSSLKPSTSCSAEGHTQSSVLETSTNLSSVRSSASTSERSTIPIDDLERVSEACLKNSISNELPQKSESNSSKLANGSMTTVCVSECEMEKLKNGTSAQTARPSSNSSEVRDLSTAEPQARGCGISKNTSTEESSFAIAEWNEELWRKANPSLTSGTQARGQIQQPVDTTSSSLDRPMWESTSSASAVEQTSVISRSLLDDSTSGTCCTTSGSTCQSRTSEDSFAIAEWNGHKHEEIPKTDRWVYLVQYVAGSEGWNCVETDAICFYSLTYSYKNWEQAHGRIDRLNTPFTDLYYYTLMSNSLIDKAVWKSLRNKKNFNESKFVFER
jgi:hypothetical protein